MAAPNPENPRAKPKDINTQISHAIAAGFDTVLSDVGAIQQEYLSSSKEMTRTLKLIERHMGEIARVSSGIMPATTMPEYEAKARAVKAGVMAKGVAFQEVTQTLDAAAERLDMKLAQAAAESNEIVRTRRPEELVEPLDDRSAPMVGPKSAQESRQQIRDRIFNSGARKIQEWAAQPNEGTVVGPNGHIMRVTSADMLSAGVHYDKDGRLRSATGKFVSPTIVEDEYPNTIQAPDGTLMQVQDGIDASTLKYDKDGHLRGPHGQFVSPSVVTPLQTKEQSSVVRRTAVAKVASEGLDAWRKGEPIGRAVTNALPTAALRVGGYALLAKGAYEAAQKGIEWVQGQAAENRKYQEYYGGTNTDQLGERANRWFNKNIRGQFSMLGGEAYDQLFSGAMQRGLRGGDRDEYIREGAQILRQGANQNQTQELMGIALDTAQSLDGLSDALARVNATARESSVSALQARDIFTANFKASSEMFFGNGMAARSMATTFTNAAVNLGAAYAGDVSYTGTQSRSLEYSNAYRLGMDIGQYREMMAVTPEVGIAADAAKTLDQLKTLRGYGEGNKTIAQVIAEYKAETGRQRIGSEDLPRISERLLAAGFEPADVRSVLAQNGVETTVEAALGQAAAYFLGMDVGSTALNDREARNEELSGNAFTPGSNGGTGSMEGKLGGYSGDLQSQKNYWGVSDTRWLYALDQAYGGKSAGGGMEAASREVSNVEMELIRSAGTYGLKPDTLVAVQTAEGEKVVYFKEAMQYYPDQIRNGSFRFEGGNADIVGRTGAEVLGLNSDFTTLEAPSATDEDLNPPVGTPIDEFREKQDKDAAKKGESGSSTIVLDLKPRVKEMFDAYLNGSAFDGGVVK